MCRKCNRIISGNFDHFLRHVEKCTGTKDQE